MKKIIVYIFSASLILIGLSNAVYAIEMPKVPISTFEMNKLNQLDTTEFNHLAAGEVEEGTQMGISLILLGLGVGALLLTLRDANSVE